MNELLLEDGTAMLAEDGASLLLEQAAGTPHAGAALAAFGYGFNF